MVYSMDAQPSSLHGRNKMDTLRPFVVTVIFIAGAEHTNPFY